MSDRHLSLAVSNGNFISGRQPDVENRGGPPHDGDMEARVAKLEVAVEYIQRDVAEMRAALDTLSNSTSIVQVDVGIIKERLEHTPTTLSMWAALLAVVVPVGAAVVGILAWVIQANLAPLLAKSAGG